MTRHVHGPDTVFEGLPVHFSQSEIVELTAAIGGYNLVLCFLAVLAVDPEQSHA